jgi:hypothetical protein
MHHLQLQNHRETVSVVWRLGVLPLLLAALLGSLIPAGAGAMTVGGPQTASGLAQPLRVRIPVSLDSGEELASNCVKALAPRGDDAPAAANVRASVQSNGQSATVLLTTTSPVLEPAVRLAVQIGCTDPVIKEFVVLLDPMPVNAPVAAAASPSAVQPSAATPAQAPQSLARAAPSAERAASKAGAPNRSRTASTRSANQQTPRQLQASQSLRPPRAIAKAAVPRADRVQLAPPDSAVLDPFLAQLRMSDGLSIIPGDANAPVLAADQATAADQAARRRLVLDQARMAAILRDEDPVAAVLAKERELNARLDDVNKSLSQARQTLEQAGSAETAKAVAPAVPPAPVNAAKPAAPQAQTAWLGVPWWLWLLGVALALGALLAAVRWRRSAGDGRQEMDWKLQLDEAAERLPARVPTGAAASSADATAAIAAGLRDKAQAGGDSDFFDITTTHDASMRTRRSTAGDLHVQEIESHTEFKNAVQQFGAGEQKPAASVPAPAASKRKPPPAATAPASAVTSSSSTQTIPMRWDAPETGGASEIRPQPFPAASKVAPDIVPIDRLQVLNPNAKVTPETLASTVRIKARAPVAPSDPLDFDITMPAAAALPDFSLELPEPAAPPKPAPAKNTPDADSKNAPPAKKPG